MYKWIDIITFDENGSGEGFPTTLRASEIIAFVDLTKMPKETKNKLGLTDVNCGLRLRNIPSMARTVETCEEIKRKLKQAGE